MSEQKNDIKKILEQSNSLLSYDTMERYIAGTLSYKEQHSVERELLANELLADALEGLKLSRSNIAREHVASVDEYLENTFGTPTRKIPYAKLTAIAAGALILLVGTFALLNQSGGHESELAKASENIEESADEEREMTTTNQARKKGLSEAAPESVEEAEQPELVAENDEAELQNDVPQPAKEQEPVASKPLADTVSLAMAAVSEDSFRSGVVTEEMEADVQSVAAPKLKEVVKRTEKDIASDMLAYSKLSAPRLTNKDFKAEPSAYGVDSYNYNTADKTEEKSKTKKSESNPAVDFLKEATDAYNSGDYKTAASKFDFVLSADPGNEKAKIYGGVAHLRSGNTSRSEELLKEAAKTKNYEDHAKWYLSATYLKEGKKNKAEKTLKDLDKSPIYSDKSKEVLDELK